MVADAFLENELRRDTGTEWLLLLIETCCSITETYCCSYIRWLSASTCPLLSGANALVHVFGFTMYELCWS